jgi:hypothetical protein
MLEPIENWRPFLYTFLGIQLAHIVEGQIRVLRRGDSDGWGSVNKKNSVEPMDILQIILGSHIEATERWKMQGENPP